MLGSMKTTISTMFSKVDSTLTSANT